MEGFSSSTRAWFEGAFAAPTEVQRRGFAAIARGEHSLLLAPTGSGKTLAAFLWALDRLSHPGDRPPPPGVQVVYVSPLKALANDVRRNLEVPLRGIAATAARLGQPVVMPEVSLRTGDTPQAERRRMQKSPPGILVTTPESLYLLLGSAARAGFSSVHTVIVDEVHALCSTKRGAHLALSLERLSLLCGEFQRIGLSATARPTADVARFLGGDRPVTIVDTSAPPRIDVTLKVPVPDMTAPLPLGEEVGEPGMWPAIHAELLALLRSHHTTIIFVNSRGLCERLSRRLNELAEEELVLAHHGSIAHGERARIEERLKSGAVSGIVATSSLELGIDMGAVDLVVMVESPGSVARGLQRIGRAGHGVGEVSVGKLFPKHRGDLLEAAVIVRRMAEGEIEPLSIVRNPLDVLAQQVVAAVAAEEQEVGALHAWVRRAANFCELTHELLTQVLDMLTGRYPSTAFADLTPRLIWDRETGLLSPRRGARLLSVMNAGTIPDRGMFGVYLGEDGPRVGELDEEMVYEASVGEVFALGASTFRIQQITKDRVVVTPAPGESGKLPFWHGDGPGRPIELGRALGAFVRELVQLPRDAAVAQLRERHGLDAFATQNLLSYLDAQREATSALPHDRCIVVERHQDELGDLRVAILSPFGSRVHAPWAIALQARLGVDEALQLQVLWNDDGILIRCADNEQGPDVASLLFDPEELQALLVQELPRTALFAGQFRENAGRALLMPRRRPTARMPLWLQRRKASELLGVAQQYPSFPLLMETYRTCLQDVFDVPALSALLADLRSQRIRLVQVETPQASPFCLSLIFEYTAAYMYAGDTPVAERRAQALNLDMGLLQELLGEQDLRALLDDDVMQAVEAELQGLLTDHPVTHEDQLADLLRRVGDLSPAELSLRVDGDPRPLLQSLLKARRVFPLHIGGESRYVTVEDVALYRDAVLTAPPSGVPAALLAAVDDAPLMLLLRFARTRGPFSPASFCERYRLSAALVRPLLRALQARGELVRGTFTAEGRGEEFCHREVLRRIKRRTLAKLRGEVAPVAPQQLARFLPVFHGIGSGERGQGRLREVIAQLQGMPLPFAELERAILPDRMPDYRPAMLDELGAMGELVWVGHGAIGARDGALALYLREEVGRLLPAPKAPEAFETALAPVLLQHLEQRGASFFASLCQAAGGLSAEEVLAALRELMWVGLVTNDTFQPLRVTTARRGAPQRTGGPSRSQMRVLSRAASGRFSLVSDLVDGAIPETVRLHRRALVLLGRHGIVGRDVVQLEPYVGGYSALYRVLSALEEGGHIRRGHFVDGAGGMQFAQAGAVDRLRALERELGEQRVVCLSAVDPANAYGWLLPWPPHTSGAQQPRRIPGASVILVDGEPLLYLSKGGRNLTSFVGIEDRARRDLSLQALSRVALRNRGRRLCLSQVDGKPAAESALSEALLEHGFVATYRGFELAA